LQYPITQPTNQAPAHNRSGSLTRTDPAPKQGPKQAEEGTAKNPDNSGEEERLFKFSPLSSLKRSGKNEISAALGEVDLEGDHLSEERKRPADFDDRQQDQLNELR
jgi:hypothetical protein